jgi:hypothetical protein
VDLERKSIKSTGGNSLNHDCSFILDFPMHLSQLNGMAEPLLIQPGEKILSAYEFLPYVRQLGGLATKGIMAQLMG